MRIIIEDDKGNELTLPDDTIKEGKEDEDWHKLRDLAELYYTFFCEVCQKTLLLSKESREPQMCEECLQDEYERATERLTPTQKIRMRNLARGKEKRGDD
ncbi:MAG: hypothetical protein ACWGQW_04840 [bacterium]